MQTLSLCQVISLLVQEALRFNRKLYRYAKGPILEGAVTVGDWGSLCVHPFRLAASRQATFPKGTALAVARKRPRPLRHGLRRATSPKGRGLGKEMKSAWTAKGSHFGGAGIA